MARARAAEKSARAQTEKKRIEIDRKIAGMVRAIEDGLYEPSMKTRMQRLGEGKGLTAGRGVRRGRPRRGSAPASKLPAIYKRHLENLTSRFEGPNSEAAKELLRSLIERVDLFPRESGKGLDAVLHGELAAHFGAMHRGSRKSEKRPVSQETGRLPSMVAGAGFEPTTFRL